MHVRLSADRIHAGERFSFTLQRTVRVPLSETRFPLPPGLGAFPIRPLSMTDFKTPLGIVYAAPTHEREALWLSFEAADWKPNAVQVGIGGINAVSGQPWEDFLSDLPQNYIVCPPQPWLDGVNTGTATVRQFVATRHGRGRTVAEQLKSSSVFFGLQVRVFEPLPGVFPDERPLRSGRPSRAYSMPQMGVAAGGEILQRIYPDPHGLHTWDTGSFAEIGILLLSPGQWQELTGEAAPPSPVDAAVYAKLGLPWFELDDDTEEDLPGAERLASVRPIGGGGDAPETPAAIDPSHIVRLKRAPDREGHS
jgi:hypothetical protein